MKQIIAWGLLIALWTVPVRAADSVADVLTPAGADAGEAVAMVEDEDSAEAGVRRFAEALELALQGDANAQLGLGLCYFNAVGTERDYAEALRWFTSAAGQNNPQAQFYVGLMYYDGSGVKRNYDEALSWYEKAAAQNDPMALTGLGLLYYRGRGVKRDLDRAFDYFNRAAALEYAEGYAHLAVMYEKGQSVTKNLAQAFEYNLLGAEGGSVFAQYNLSRMYYRGRGVEKDLVQAYKWIAISRFMGNDSDQAMEHMNMVSKWLSSKEFDIAKEQTTEWLEKHGGSRRPLFRVKLF